MQKLRLFVCENMMHYKLFRGFTFALPKRDIGRLGTHFTVILGLVPIRLTDFPSHTMAFPSLAKRSENVESTLGSSTLFTHSSL